jgi:hypothetical protein
VADHPVKTKTKNQKKKKGKRNMLGWLNHPRPKGVVRLPQHISFSLVFFFKYIYDGGILGKKMSKRSNYHNLKVWGAKCHI